ncbi:MAG TPA: hypothetical protein VF941_03745 [Clostridia bacterium]
MLTDKKYLLLCEFAGMDVLNIETGSIAEITKSLLKSGEFGQNVVINELAENFKDDELRLNSISKFGDITVYAFDDCGSNVFVISSKTIQKNSKTAEYQDAMMDFIMSFKDSGPCVVTGLESGGLHALNAASRLTVEGVLFRVPGSEELGGNVRNLVSENDPIGEYREKIVFVKQKSEEINPDRPLSQILLFDENGNAVTGEQSEYSKFCSWFYNTAGKIDNDIWSMFFMDTSEDNVFEDKDLYSIFLRINELNLQGVKNSLENTIKRVENKLQKNIDAMKLEFENNIFKIDDKGFDELICEIAEKAAQNAAFIVKNAYKSVETILMGIGIFSLGSNTFDNEILMEKFSEDIDSLLDKEAQRIKDFIQKEEEYCLNELSTFPEISVDEE